MSKINNTKASGGNKGASASSGAGEKKKQSRRDIASIRKKESGTYLVFNDGVEITFKGQKLDLGEYRTVKVKTAEEVIESNNVFVEKGFIEQDEADRRNEMLETKNIKGVIQLPLAE